MHRRRGGSGLIETDHTHRVEDQRVDTAGPIQPELTARRRGGDRAGELLNRCTVAAGMPRPVTSEVVGAMTMTPMGDGSAPMNCRT